MSSFGPDRPWPNATHRSNPMGSARRSAPAIDRRWVGREACRTNPRPRPGRGGRERTHRKGLPTGPGCRSRCRGGSSGPPAMSWWQEKMREIAVSAPGFFCAMKMSETSTKLELQNRAEGDRLAGYHTAPRNKVRAENSHDLGRDSLFLIVCHPSRQL